MRILFDSCLRLVNERGMMFDPRGSLWQKWDLHVHTPASLVHSYPGSADEAWELFLADLESLPAEFHVLGINDYFFIDGYERLVAEKQTGRLSNIDLLLPVIELRLNVFGGTRSNWSRVNAHVFFSETLGPDVIRDQFIRALASSFQLTPSFHGKGLEWSGALTRSALEDLGAAIIASVPDEERGNYGSPLAEGFGNLTVSLENVRAVLDRSYFRNTTLLGVGKTEWADVKWTGGAIADKKNVINKADVIFTAAESPAAYHRARTALAKQSVNDRLLDCSDAHHPSDAEHKDRVGNSHTWIKASPTFGGLRQALQEFEQRVYVGLEPPQLSRVREHAPRYIDHVTVRPLEASKPPGRWFDADVPLNAGLVAIIGNRGSGKSALAESIALAGNSPREADFSFLSSTKFREPRHNPSQFFRAEVTWLDGEVSGQKLSESPEAGATVRVQHLPQQYLEKLCNEVPRGEKTEFDRELERIIFSHLPEEDRMGAATLGERVELGSRSRTAKLKTARDSLTELNARIVRLEALTRPEERRARLEAYHTARREWLQTRSAPPPAASQPSGDDPAREATSELISQFAEAEGHLSDLRGDARTRLAEVRRLTSDLAGFRTELGALVTSHAALLEDNEELLSKLGLDASVSTIDVKTDRLDEAEAQLSQEGAELEESLNLRRDRSLPSALKYATDQGESLRAQLDAPAERYQDYLKAYRQWQVSVREMLGDRDTPDSVLGRRVAWQALRAVPNQLKEAEAKRLKLTGQIHSILVEEAAAYSDLYGPLEDHMRMAPIPDEYRLTVDTSLVDAGFTELFLEDRINRHVAGSFCGREVSLKTVTDLLDGTDFNDTDSVIELVQALDARLHFDHRSDPPAEVDPGPQVKKGHSLEEVYDFLFGLEYLSPRFALRFGTRPIHLLSPGEKGVLLLIFFLLAETNTRPLIIDQPEDNLESYPRKLWNGVELMG
jgi:hypothetical protein